MTKERMMDLVIRKYGFEAEEAVQFCQMCESGYPMLLLKRCF